MAKINDIHVRIPQPQSLETAIRIFYEKTEIGSAEIRELFGIRSSATTAKLKRLARAQMAEDSVPVWNAQKVNTKSAFVAWGLDISDLETRFKKLKQLTA